MTYDLVLIGNKTISITEEQKKVLDALLLEKGEGAEEIEAIRLGNTTIKLSSIRGIFESVNVNLQPNNEKFNRNQLEWDADCKRLSELPIEEKISQELLVRIFPARFLELAWINAEVNIIYEQVKKVVTDFFTANPRYPRCPVRFWFLIIKPYVNTKVAKFYEVVGENDRQIFVWAKKNKIKLVESIQSSI